MEINKIYQGYSEEHLESIEDDSIDFIGTDPPYALVADEYEKEKYSVGFMGKKWDSDLASEKVWKECYRVLKEGHWLFVMSSPRQDVYIENLLRIRNAGFKINFSSVYWCYASGFSKAGNAGLLIDKRACREELEKELGRKPTSDELRERWKNYREVTGKQPNQRDKRENILSEMFHLGDGNLTAPRTEVAKELDGACVGMQLKPAVEIIIVALKKESNDAYIDMALRNRGGIAWLDDCRIPFQNEDDLQTTRNKANKDVKKFQDIPEQVYNKDRHHYIGLFGNPTGRFPAHLLVSDDILDDRGYRIRSVANPYKRSVSTKDCYLFGHKKVGETAIAHGDYGDFSRFFSLDAWDNYHFGNDRHFVVVPKPSQAEKQMGCEKLVWETEEVTEKNWSPLLQQYIETKRTVAKKKGNIHPTVKPLKLCRYLTVLALGRKQRDCVCLDPFCGSGSFLIAFSQLGHDYIGIDVDDIAFKIAKARLKAHPKQTGLIVK